MRERLKFNFDESTTIIELFYCPQGIVVLGYHDEGKLNCAINQSRPVISWDMSTYDGIGSVDL